MRALPAIDDGREVARTFSPDLQDVRHLWLKALLLWVWAAVSFGVCFFARDLVLVVAGWPLGYWIASQGAVLVFIVIVAVYAWAMGRFERQEAAAAQAPPPVLPPDASHD
jgi:putative solute:sodium symporter small subunit